MRKPLIEQRWWKLLTALLLLYTFSAGFLVPLKPGLLTIDKSELNLGDYEKLEITTYNTKFSDQSQLEAFLKLSEDYVLLADKVDVKARNLVESTFSIPESLPVEGNIATATMVLYSPSEGYMIMPSALLFKNNGGNISSEGWQNKVAEHQVAWNFSFPFRAILYETIRNTFFHVAIWMAMFVLLIVGFIYSIKYLQRPSMHADAVSQCFTLVAVIFGCIGMVTGSVWAKNTWGAYWTNDPKLNMASVAMIIYLGYLILRSSIADEEQRARIAAAYNVFAFVAMIPLVFIIPRLTSSLHPGNGGNPALGGEDLDDTLRLVFYPTIIGFTLFGVWVSSLFYRLRAIEIKLLNNKLAI